MEYQSTIDPSRPTTGHISIQALKNNFDPSITVGDMAYEMTKSLVEDINEAILSNPFENRPFYITIYERKDLLQPNNLQRSIFKTEYRPWPEDCTDVFYHDPRKQETLFCWSIPHWSAMDNMLANEDLYSAEDIVLIKAWKRLDLHHFGFMKDQIGNWIPNPHFKDKPLEKPKLILTI